MADDPPFAIHVTWTCYGTWLPGGPSACPCDDTEARWVGMPLRVVRGQDRATVDRRNDLGYDGLLVTDRD